MLEFLVVAVVGSVLLAALIWTLIYRAMGSAIDWLILTFGNPESVERLKHERGWSDAGTPPEKPT